MDFNTVWFPQLFYPFLIVMLVESRQVFFGMCLILSHLDYVLYNLESKKKNAHNLVWCVNRQQSVRGYEHRNREDLAS